MSFDWNILSNDNLWKVEQQVWNNAYNGMVIVV